MADEPTLPRLPAVSWDERSQSFSNNPRKRGRTLRSFPLPSSTYNSSDPAIFSSDDDQAVDNYVEGRRKRQYVGSWFSQQPASSDPIFADASQQPRTKRNFSRQQDSGVFLGSDGTDGEDTVLDIPQHPKPKLPQLQYSPRNSTSSSEHRARRYVQTCIDNGEETIELYSFGLHELSNETIAPLAQAARIPLVAKDVAFENQEPELKLNLAVNMLTWLPGAIFDLRNLTVLSLRANRLQELPPSISKLCNLVELNVAQNELKDLPVELIDLFTSSHRLHTLVMHPNPFRQPSFEVSEPSNMTVALKDCSSPIADGERNEITVLPRWPKFLTRLLGVSSHIDTFDSFGRQLSAIHHHGESVASEDVAESEADLEPTFNKHSVCAVPSLVELAMRSCYDSSLLAEMHRVMPDDLSSLKGLLAKAMSLKREGGMTCSRCRRQVVNPSMQWTEWRTISVDSGTLNTNDVRSPREMRPHSLTPGEIAVPFRHRACTGRCGPRAASVKAWELPAGWDAQFELLLDDMKASSRA